MLITKKFVFFLLFYSVLIIGESNKLNKVNNKLDFTNSTTVYQNMNGKDNYKNDNMNYNKSLLLGNFNKAIDADKKGNISLGRKYIRSAYLELKPNNLNYNNSNNFDDYNKVTNEYKRLLDEQAALDRKVH